MTTFQIYEARQNRVVTVEKIEKSDAEWKKLLTKKQYEITTNKVTEAPGSCLFNEVHEPGIFQCVRCGTDLFRSSTKFESGTGWPSSPSNVKILNIMRFVENKKNSRVSEEVGKHSFISTSSVVRAQQQF